MTQMKPRRQPVRSILTYAAAFVAVTPLDASAMQQTAFKADEVIAKTRAAYAALTSYADSGTVLEETTGFTDRHTFRMLLSRDPRNLLIEFRSVASEYKSGNRLPLSHQVVLWLEKGDLHTWGSRSQSHETFPADDGQQQVNAIKGANYSTLGVSILVPSFFYTKAGIVSAVHATEEAEADGYETVNGRRCFRIQGVEKWRYPSGRETGVRAITIWIDAETYLIQKVLQDTPRGYPRGEISRRTTTLKHRANPKLDPAQFRFVVPAS
jgi:hypothetical protein